MNKDSVTKQKHPVVDTGCSHATHPNGQITNQGPDIVHVVLFVHVVDLGGNEFIIPLPSFPSIIIIPSGHYKELRKIENIIVNFYSDLIGTLLGLGNLN